MTEVKAFAPAVHLSCLSPLNPGQAGERQLTFGIEEELANEYLPGRRVVPRDVHGTRAVVTLAGYKGTGE
jgi:hypothetical protein